MKTLSDISYSPETWKHQQYYILYVQAFTLHHQWKNVFNQTNRSIGQNKVNFPVGWAIHRCVNINHKVFIHEITITVTESLD